MPTKKELEEQAKELKQEILDLRKELSEKGVSDETLDKTGIGMIKEVEEDGTVKFSIVRLKYNPTSGHAKVSSIKESGPQSNSFPVANMNLNKALQEEVIKEIQ